MRATIRYYGTTPKRVEVSAIKKDGTLLWVGEAHGVEWPFNFSRWKEPPHVALANLRDEPEAVQRFICTYGVPLKDFGREARFLYISEILKLRDELRQAWAGDDEAFLRWLDFQAKATVWVRPSEVEIVIEDLWTLIVVMFARDEWDRHTQRCLNPACPDLPYFLTARKGQKFCSQRCAVLINVRRFRAREAKKSNSPRRRVKDAKAKKA